MGKRDADTKLKCEKEKKILGKQRKTSKKVRPLLRCIHSEVSIVDDGHSLTKTRRMYLVFNFFRFSFYLVFFVCLLRGVNLTFPFLI